jgi:DNA-binding response OmpR family regulator
MSVQETVLIVDDEEILLETIAFNLEKSGFKTLKASDGNSGLALALQEKPSLVILDVMLPGMTGWDICRALRESPEFPKNTPIIMLTARSAGSDRAKGYDAGADDYLIKPFVMKELIDHVRLLLEY